MSNSGAGQSAGAIGSQPLFQSSGATNPIWSMPQNASANTSSAVAPRSAADLAADRHARPSAADTNDSTLANSLRSQPVMRPPTTTSASPLYQPQRSSSNSPFLSTIVDPQMHPIPGFTRPTEQRRQIHALPPRTSAPPEDHLSQFMRLANTRSVLNSGYPLAVPNSSSRTTGVRPQFRSKIVCEISCRHCDVTVCKRGMKAILLADTNVELYSTDSPPFGVQLVLEDYVTRNCQCRIRDVACLGCGNVLGYHVTQPCETCLDACNNGHFWMFHINEIYSCERIDENKKQTLLWAHLPRADLDWRPDEIKVHACR